MDITRNQIIADSELFKLDVEGIEFFPQMFPLTNQPTRTEFLVKKQTEDLHVEYPSHYSRKIYHQKYGPYSIDLFSKKVQAIYTSFHDAERIRDQTRLFVRKMWVFKTLFETFENSMELILVRLSKMIPNIFAKALNIIESVDNRSEDYIGCGGNR